MNLTLNGIIASSGGVVIPDTDGQAYIDRVVAAGGSLTTTEQNAVKQLVVDLKAYGIWNSIQAAYPMIGNSSIAVRQNLISSSFTGTITGTVAVSSTGITGDGSTGYMDTGYNPATSGLLDSAHLSIYSRTIGASTSDSGDIGAGTTPPNRFQEILIRDTYDGLLATLNGNVDFLTNTDSHGFYIASRINGTEIKVYKNNSLHGTLNRLSALLPNRNIFVCGVNSSAGIEYGNKQIAFASIGRGLTGTQANNYYTAVQAFQTALSRNV